MKYAEIYNNQIIKIHNSLPDSWNNISNFNALSQHEIYDLSWSGNFDYKFYILEENQPPINNGLYDISGPEYFIDDINYKVSMSWISTPVAHEQAWDTIRQIRNQKLYSSDWTQLPDSPLDSTTKNNYSIYRQQLRDITQQPDPFNIQWPTLPE